MAGRMIAVEQGWRTSNAHWGRTMEAFVLNLLTRSDILTFTISLRYDTIKTFKDREKGSYKLQSRTNQKTNSNNWL